MATILLPALGLLAKIVIGILVFISLAIMVVARDCFDDSDPYIDWHNNYVEAERPHVAMDNCPHINKTDIPVNVAATCEKIYTMCDDCNEVLNIRIDC